MNKNEQNATTDALLALLIATERLIGCGCGSLEGWHAKREPIRMAVEKARDVLGKRGVR